MADTTELARAWPLFGLRISAGPVRLTVPGDEHLAALAAIAQAGIHDPADMPFAAPWTDTAPDDFARLFMQFHWAARSSHKRDNWRFDFAVERDDQLVGMQGVGAEQFAVTRTVSSGSWLGRRFQGVGTGRLMRAVILEFVFTHLGAQQASSSILDANERSRRVSLGLGYQPNGSDVRVVRGVRRSEERYLLGRDSWLRRDDRPRLEVEGLDACAALLGVTG